ncbi:MAG TPA: hypothetical protein VH143_32215, partial [Kofleriaceae bacterium]|nr:hypothetical protein [Kofleriaceae bacterium]
MRALVALVMLASCGAKKHAAGDAAPVAKPAGAVIATDAAVAAKPPRIEHAAFDFVDNRHAAHRAIGGELVVDAGDIGFARFVRFGLPSPRWHLGHVIDGERAAIADRFAPLEIPLPVAAHEAAQQITLRVHADAKQKLIVHVGATKLAPIVLEPGWQVVAAAVGKGGFGVGENDLALETKSPIALAWLRVGPSHPSADAAPLAAATFDAKAGAIELARDAELAWYVTIPDGANLVAHVDGPCRVEVAARAGDDSLTAGAVAADRDRVDLSASAGKVVRLA